MKITELDHDALSLLSALVAPNDVGSWRLACRTLGEAAHPYRFRRLVLRTPTQLRDVCESVVKTPDCARHILYLTMGNGCLGSPSNWGDRDFRDSLIPHIADLMRAAVNLVSLTMESAESFLANSPTLVAAVTVCSRLETLVLEQHHWEYEDLSHGTAALFAALRAPLRVLKLSSINNGEFPVHIFTLLQHVTPTLESLDMNLVEIEPWSEQGPAPVFPRVTTLYLRYASAHVQTLEAAFPMLRELMLELDNGLDPYMYAENTAYMLAHWKHLAILSGGIGSLWTLALRDVEVDLLMMNDYARDEEGMEARRAVLRGVRPHMLHVCVCADIEGETLIAHDLPECAPAVRILDLDVSLERCSGALNAQVVMTFLVRTHALSHPAPDAHHLTLRPAQTPRSFEIDERAGVSPLSDCTHRPLF
jgi:hypothetical protein